eukprot:6158917-Pyramimonas_sp.AAC.1
MGEGAPIKGPGGLASRGRHNPCRWEGQTARMQGPRAFHSGRPRASKVADDWRQKQGCLGALDDVARPYYGL